MMLSEGDAPPAGSDRSLYFLSTRELQIEHSHAVVERSKGNISENAFERITNRLARLRAELDLRS